VSDDLDELCLRKIILPGLVQVERKLIGVAADNERGDGAEIGVAVEHWQEDGGAAVVWDGASRHRAALILAQDLSRVVQPPASPELNPAERVVPETQTRD